VQTLVNCRAQLEVQCLVFSRQISCSWSDGLELTTIQSSRLEKLTVSILIRKPFFSQFTSINITLEALWLCMCVYRQWVLSEFGLWDGELDYVTRLITDDLRNNSAWNQRYFVVVNTTGFTDDVIAREIKSVFDFIWSLLHISCKDVIEAIVPSPRPGVLAPGSRQF